MRVYYDDLFLISWYILFLIFFIYITRFIIIFRIIIKALVTIIVCVIFKGFIFVVILNNFLADKVSSDVETSSFKLVLVSVTKPKSIFSYHSGLLFGAKLLPFRGSPLISHHFRLIVLYFAWSVFVSTCKDSYFPLPKFFALLQKLFFVHFLSKNL